MKRDLPEGNRDLRERTKQFALRIIKLYCALPKTPEAQILGKQVLRSGTSPGAHYREAERARSRAEFVSKIQGGLQDLDETAYWLELLGEAGIVASKRLADLREETCELTKIFAAITIQAKKSR